MEYGCIAGTGTAAIVYLLFGIKFIGRPEDAFFSPRFAIPRFRESHFREQLLLTSGKTGATGL